MEPLKYQKKSMITLIVWKITVIFLQPPHKHHDDICIAMCIDVTINSKNVITKKLIPKKVCNKREPTFMGPLQVWPMVCGSRGSKNVTYRQQTTDKKVNTEPL